MKTIEANVAFINHFLKPRDGFEIEFKKSAIDELTDSIQAINEIFQNVLDELLEKSDAFILDPVHPLRKIMWERHSGKSVEEAFDGMYAQNSSETSNYQIHVGHGHSGIDGVYPSLKNCTSNIDGAVGKPGHNKGILRTIDCY